MKEAVQARLLAEHVDGDPWMPMPHADDAATERQYRPDFDEIWEYKLRQAWQVAEHEDYPASFERPSVDVAKKVWRLLTQTCGLETDWTHLCGAYPSPLSWEKDERRELEHVTYQAVTVALAHAIEAGEEGTQITVETLFVLLCEGFSDTWRSVLNRTEQEHLYVDALLISNARAARRDLVLQQVAVTFLYDLVTKLIPACPQAPYTVRQTKSVNGGYSVDLVKGHALTEIKKALTQYQPDAGVRRAYALHPASKPVNQPPDRAKWAGERAFNVVTPQAKGRALLDTLSSVVLKFNGTAFLQGFDQATDDMASTADALRSSYGVEIRALPRLAFPVRRGMAFKQAKLALGVETLTTDQQAEIEGLLRHHDRVEKPVIAYSQVESQVRELVQRHDHMRSLLNLPPEPFYLPITTPYARVLNQRFEPENYWPVRVTPKRLREHELPFDFEDGPGGFNFYRGLRFNFFKFPGVDGTGVQSMTGVDVSASQYESLALLLGLRKLERVACEGTLWPTLAQLAKEKGILGAEYQGPHGEERARQFLKKVATQVGYGATNHRVLRDLWSERDEYGLGFDTDEATSEVGECQEGETEQEYRRRLGQTRASIAARKAEEFESRVWPDGRGLRTYREACKLISRVAMALDPYEGVTFQDPYDHEQAIRWNPVRRAPVKLWVGSRSGTRYDGSVRLCPPGEWVETDAGALAFEAFKRVHGVAAQDGLSKVRVPVTLTRSKKPRIVQHTLQRVWSDLRKKEKLRPSAKVQSELGLPTRDPWVEFIPAEPCGPEGSHPGDFPVDINDLRRTLAPSIVHTLDSCLSALVVTKLHALRIPVVDLRDSWLVPETVLVDGVECAGLDVLTEVVRSQEVGEAWFRSLGPVLDMFLAYLGSEENLRRAKVPAKHRRRWVRWARATKARWLRRVRRCARGLEPWPVLFVKPVDPGK